MKIITYHTDICDRMSHLVDQCNLLSGPPPADRLSSELHEIMQRGVCAMGLINSTTGCLDTLRLMRSSVMIILYRTAVR